jgi:hypothetical protein
MWIMGPLFVMEPGDDHLTPLPVEGLPPPGAAEGEVPPTRFIGVAWDPAGDLLVATDHAGLFRLGRDADAWVPASPAVELVDVSFGEPILGLGAHEVLRLSDDGASWSSVGEARVPELWESSTLRSLARGDDGALWVASSTGVYRLDGGDGQQWQTTGTGGCSAYADAVFVGAGEVYCQHEDEWIAELVDGRWTRIPRFGYPGHHGIPLTVGPEGALYMDFGLTLRGQLVRTLP